ncbi:ABC transporter ATP-binding protein [Herbiconiux sp. KACC 21604]|uniref:ABC transporter ATP-binding protein n=1 Tax=unclassified Herbiconiux TaxID=2618217 RepID=UPI001492AC76|nr:ABC transporter ATP-binding protein [Herbiconiux sp. SALV-R1]QJU54152.1 ABC transporter ATP-binding protein [Herbiconiux sp. SALV-R1]WPO85205.1 ABC transporter ATP-binding protein [Herbiconiux sp. KACC 21604]
MTDQTTTDSPAGPATASAAASAPGTPGAAVVVDHVSHTYGRGESAHQAIRDLAFSVQPKEFVSIVGPSGAGKTTLLRTLAGLLQPSEGAVWVNGVRSTGVPDGMAMVFQDYSRSLLPWLSVERNVAFPLQGSSISKTERRSLVAESLEAVGLRGFEKRYPWQLSGGMQQRVAIARALAYRPKLLLMDEPFASVDAQTREGLEDLVLQIRDRYHMTILFVTHDIDESVYLADRVLVLSRPPATLVEDISIELPEPRDQITTRENPEFIQLRGHVARLIHGGPAA